MLRVTILCVLIALALPVRDVAACSCVALPEPLEALDRTDVVFVGSAASPVPGGDYRVRFRIEYLLKGPSQAELVVYTPPKSAGCGYHFREGRRYLVYARHTAEGFYTDLCTRTARLPDAREDLAAFGLDHDRLDDPGKGRGRRLVGAGWTAVRRVLAFVLFGGFGADGREE